MNHIYSDRDRQTGAHPDTGAIHNNQIGGVSDSGTGFRGTVKRFEVEVTDGNGLQITLINAGGQPLVNAIRILRTDHPLTVTDVTLRSTSALWTRNPFDFANMVQTGWQLRNIATNQINTVEIQFSEDIRKRSADGLTLSPIGSGSTEGNELLTLKRSYRDSNVDTKTDIVSAINFTYNTATHLGRWVFSTGLDDGKYAIHLRAGVNGVVGIADVQGNPLDVDWTNDPGTDAMGRPTWDDYTDDPQRLFTVGNRVPGGTNNEYRFHFAILIGDYNGDGVVKTFDTPSSSNTYSDGNGDGFYNSADTTVRNGNLNDFLPKIGRADLDGDESVDGIDLTIWQTGNGGSTVGEVDGDGDADGQDFLLWQRAFGTYSAWGDPPFLTAAAAYAASVGLTLEDLTVGLPPQVVNVIISGSQSTHDPFSFDTVDGSGSQLASVPVGAADTISIVFSENVNVSAQSLIVVGLRTASVPQIAEFDYDAVTFTATWRLESWAMGDQYLLYLADSITDVEGNFLDGEWTNPASISTTNSLVSTFPSGDGISGGSFSFVMTLLPDIDQNNIVNYTDYYTAYYGEIYGVTGNFSNGDFNGNGIIDQEDVDLVNSFMWLSLQNIEMLVDLNGDLQVDNSDLTIIGSNYGMTGATREDGDLDGDQQITDADLDLAFAQFGLGFDLVA